ncbi:hypothetical protein D9M69_628580 [compost metagenome]
MVLERAAVDADELAAMHGHGAFVQRLQRQQLTGRRGQDARHDQAAENRFDVRARYLRRHLFDAHPGAVTPKVIRQVRLLFVQADRHADRGVAGLQARHVQFHELHARGA